MDRDKKIRREVEETMRSLDHIERAETGAHFYDGIREALRNRDTDSRHEARVLTFRRVAAAAAAILLLILANLFTILQYDRSYGSDETMDSREVYLEAFAREYELEIETIYADQPNGEEQL